MDLNLKYMLLCLVLFAASAAVLKLGLMWFGVLRDSDYDPDSLVLDITVIASVAIPVIGGGLGVLTSAGFGVYYLSVYILAL